MVFHAARTWIEHDASTMGAALAFYTVFSVAPILIIAIGVLGAVINADTVRAELLPQMQTLFGEAGASAVQMLLLSASRLGSSRMATIIGVITLVLGASSVFVELQNSLDRIWGLPKRTRLKGLWHLIRGRFLSLGLVFGVGFLLMVCPRIGAKPIRHGDYFCPPENLVGWQDPERLAWKYVPSEENNKVFGREQSFVAGDPTNVQFMVKDTKKYAATGGWGFAQFNDGKPVDAAGLGDCFACHVPVKDRDFLFTRYAP